MSQIYPSNKLVDKNGAFQDNIVEQLCCTLCLQLPLSPYSCIRCVAIYCHKCIEPYIEQKCPVCNQTPTPKMPFTFPNNILTKLLENININCENKKFGCEVLIPCNQLDIEKHDKVCEFKKMICEYQNCNEEFYIKDKNDHINNCEHKTFNCEYCDEDILFHQFEIHQQECKQSICQYCCKAFSKNDLQNHENNCENQYIECPECKNKYTLVQLAEHDEQTCKKLQKKQQKQPERQMSPSFGPPQFGLFNQKNNQVPPQVPKIKLHKKQQNQSLFGQQQQQDDDELFNNENNFIFNKKKLKQKQQKQPYRYEDQYEELKEGDQQEQEQQQQQQQGGGDNSIKAFSLKQRGNKSLQNNQYEQAKIHYIEAIRYDPNNPVLYTNLANAEIQLQNYYEAIVQCDKALQIDPQHMKAFLRKGDAQNFLEQFDQALMNYQSAHDCTKDIGQKVEIMDKIKKLKERKEKINNQNLGQEKRKYNRNRLSRPYQFEEQQQEQQQQQFYDQGPQQFVQSEVNQSSNSSRSKRGKNRKRQQCVIF